MKHQRDLAGDAMYLMHYVRTRGGPMWGRENAGGGAFARLTKANAGDDPLHRFRVFAVPPEYAGLSLDSLIQAARSGALEKVFEDRVLMAKWGVAA